MGCACGPGWHCPSKTQWAPRLNSSAPKNLSHSSAFLGAQNFPLQSASHFLLFGGERTTQATILQTFPLPPRPRVGNWCHLAQPARFCWGFLFTQKKRKKRSYTWIDPRAPFLERCVGRVGWSDGEFFMFVESRETLLRILASRGCC